MQHSSRAPSASSKHGSGVGASPAVGPATPEPLAALQDDQLSVASSSEGGYASSNSSVGVPPPASLAAAVHEVPSLLSQLVSGLPDEQVRAGQRGCDGAGGSVFWLGPGGLGRGGPASLGHPRRDIGGSRARPAAASSQPLSSRLLLCTQVLAAKKLFKNCRSGEEVQRAVVAEVGGCCVEAHRDPGPLPLGERGLESLQSSFTAGRSW